MHADVENNSARHNRIIKQGKNETERRAVRRYRPPPDTAPEPEPEATPNSHAQPTVYCSTHRNAALANKCSVSHGRR